MIDHTGAPHVAPSAPPSHLACGPYLKDGSQLCADAYACRYYRHHDGRIYRIFNCARAYPKR